MLKLLGVPTKIYELIALVDRFLGELFALDFGVAAWEGENVEFY